MELSKQDKKAARELIEKGLQREIENELRKVNHILENWKCKEKNNKETYYQLYKHIANFDKHIAHRYDGITGSRYLLTIISQLHDNVIHVDDLVDFSEEVRLYLTRNMELFKMI